jgi:hypothetical protein
MKTIFVNLLAVVVLFLLGCQENQITDPVPEGISDKTQIQDEYKYGTISLQRMLTDPNPVGNSYFNIYGQVDYKYKVVAANPMGPSSQTHFDLNLNIIADLSYYCSVCPFSEEDELAGSIEAGSEDIIPVTGHFISQIEKTYKINGREDGMVLKCRFLITTNGVELSAMWLALENKSVKATDNY